MIWTGAIGTWLPRVIGLGLAALVLSACEPTPEQARQGIIDRGYPYTAEGLVQALNDDNKSVYLRFFIADTDHKIVNTAMLIKGACTDRPYSQRMDCLYKNGISLLVIRGGADVHYADDTGRNLAVVAADNGQEDLLKFVLNQNVNVDDYAVIERAKSRMTNEFDKKKRERFERIANLLQVRWTGNRQMEIKAAYDKQREQKAAISGPPPPVDLTAAPVRARTRLEDTSKKKPVGFLGD